MLPILWKDVAASDKFKSLTAEQKIAVRDRYFSDVLLPVLPEDTDFESARRKFADATMPERGWGEALSDLGASVASGAASVAEMAATANSLVTGNIVNNDARDMAKSAVNYWNDKKSDRLKMLEAERGRRVAGADGIIDEAKTAISETVTNPALLTSFAAEQVPQLVGPAAAGRVTGAVVTKAGEKLGEKAITAFANKAATGAAIGTGAVMQGADIGGDTYDAALKAAKEQGYNDVDAAAAALEAARKAAVVSGGVSVLTNMLPGAQTVERVVAGAGGRTGSRVVNTLAGAAGEGVSEALEESGGKLASNLMVAGIDPNQSLTKGVGEAGGLGLLGGVGMGGVTGALERPTASTIPQTGNVEQDIDNILSAPITKPGEGAAAPIPASEVLGQEVPDAEIQTTAGATPAVDAGLLGQAANVPAAPGPASPVESEVRADAPLVARKPIPEPQFSGIDEFVQTAKARGVDEAVAREIAPKAGRDEVTGYYDGQAAGVKSRTIQGAIEHVKQTGEDTHLVAMDFANLGGLNAVSGNNTKKANKHYRAVTDIAEKRLRAIGADVVPMRTGGDELMVVVGNAETKAINKAIAQIETEVAAYAKANGLDSIPHPKGGLPGIGLHIGRSRIGPKSTVDAVIAAAEKGLNVSKTRKENVNRSQTEAPGNVRSEGQPAGATEAQRAGAQPARATDGARPGGAAPAAQAQPAAEGVASPVAELSGDKISDKWTAFAEDSGTLGIPRAEMPQIKAESRGALVNFIKSRGIPVSKAKTVDPRTLKPTQAEFSEAKVETARKRTGGDRAILVSVDGHVIDGHHQWLAALQDGKPVKVQKLAANIRKSLDIVGEFPGAKTSKGAESQKGDIGIPVSDQPQAADSAAADNGNKPGQSTLPPANPNILLSRATVTQAGMRPATAEDRKRLKIPPAWTDVVVAQDAEARLQAVGTDTAGRRQYLYSEDYELLQLAMKFERLMRFDEDFADIYSRIYDDAEAGVEEAVVLRLIAQTGFRVGGESTGKTEAYGASTLKPEHVKVQGEQITFDFPGKGGVRQQHMLRDADIARDIKNRMKRDQLFETNDSAIRTYLKDITGGEDYKVHDFRSWNATVEAATAVADRPAPKTVDEYWTLVDEVGDIAAAKIGDTRDVALESYVDPAVFDEWRLAVGVREGDPRPKKGIKPNVVFEVAPDPNNEALTNRWRQLSQDDRLAVSRDVARKLLPEFLARIGASGQIKTQVGSYLEDTNPSFALALKAGDPVEVAKALGYGLAQDSMVVLSEKQFPGGSRVGAVTVEIGDKSSAEIDAIYQVLRDIKAGDEQPIAGQSTVNGVMTILNYSNVETAELADLADKALEGEYQIGYTEVFSAFPGKQEYDYGSAQIEARGADANAGDGDADRIRQQAVDLRKRVDAELQRQLARRAPASRPESAGDARVSVEQGSGQEVNKASVEALVERVTEGWSAKPSITVVQSVDELPADVREDVRMSFANDIEGMFDSLSGNVYLIADNLSDMERAEFVLLHESLGHGGLRRLLGNQLNPVLNSLYAGNSSVAALTRAKQRMYGYDRMTAIEEALADMAGTGAATKLKGWDRLVKAVLDILASLNFKRKWTDDEVLGLVAAAGRTITHGSTGSLSVTAVMTPGSEGVAVGGQSSRLASEPRRRRTTFTEDEIDAILDGDLMGEESGYNEDPTLSNGYFAEDVVQGVPPWMSGTAPTQEDRDRIDDMLNRYQNVNAPFRGEVAAQRIGNHIKKIWAKRPFSDDQIRELGRAWLEIGRNKDFYTYEQPAEGETDLENILYDMAGSTIKVREKKVEYDAKLALSVTRLDPNIKELIGSKEFVPVKHFEFMQSVTEPVSGEKRVYTADLYEDKNGYLTLSIAGFKPRITQGALVYQAVGTWAARNNKVFVGDPMGISTSGLYRRAENMMVNALRTQSTDHLKLHPAHTDAGLVWRKGDAEYNVGLTSLWLRDTISVTQPELFANEVLARVPTGNALAHIDTGAIEPGIAREVSAGVRTLARAAIAETWLRRLAAGQRLAGDGQGRVASGKRARNASGNALVSGVRELVGRSPRFLYSRASRITSPSGPVDRVFRALGGKQLAERVTKPLYNRFLGLGRFVPERVKAGVVADYGLPEPYIDERTRMQIAQRSGAKKAQRVVEALSGLDRAQSRVAYQWMTQREAEGDALLAQLPAEAQTALQEVKQLITDLGKEAVSLGQLSQESFDRNKMAYLHRSYAKFDLDESSQEKFARQRAIKILGEQYKGRGLVDFRDGVVIGTTPVGEVNKGEKFVRFERRDSNGVLRAVRYIRQDEALRMDAKAAAKWADWREDGVWEARYFKGSQVGMWRDFTQEERQRMGELDEVKYAVAKTMLMMTRDIESGRLLNWVAKSYARDDDEGINVIETPQGRALETWAKDDWVQVPETQIPGTQLAQYGNLAGKFIPAAMWNDIRQISNMKFSPFGEFYRDLLNFWKISKTALSPGVHTNNVMSNFIMADFADVGVRDIVRSLETMVRAKRGDADAKALLDRYDESGGELGSFALNELNKDTLEPLLDELRKELGRAEGGEVGSLVKASQIVHLMAQGQFREAWEKAGSTKGFLVSKGAVEAMIRMYQAEDTVFRLAAFQKALAEGKTDQEAGKVARESFLDYNINAPWIQNARATFLPFIAFSYRAIPMLLRTAAEKPWKFAKYFAAAGGLNALAYAMLGLGAEDEERERRMLPDEKSGKIWGVFPRLLRMPWNDANGSPVFLDIRRWIPVGDVLDMNQNHAAIGWPQTLFPGGPIVMMGEVALNTKAFDGKAITADTDTATEKAGKMADYLWKAFMPNFPGLPFTYSTDALVNAGKGKTDAFGREQSLPQAAASAAGVKVSAYPEDVLQTNLKSKLTKVTLELDKEAAAVRREFARNGIDDAEMTKRLDRITEKKLKAREEFAKKVGG